MHRCEKFYHLDRVKRIWYLSPMRAAKVQASLRIRAVSPEPPLLAHTSTESRGTFRQKTMAGHAQLKFVMTECSKTQIRLTGPIYNDTIYMRKIYAQNRTIGNKNILKTIVVLLATSAKAHVHQDACS